MRGLLGSPAPRPSKSRGKRTNCRRHRSAPTLSVPGLSVRDPTIGPTRLAGSTYHNSSSIQINQSSPRSTPLHPSIMGTRARLFLLLSITLRFGSSGTGDRHALLGGDVECAACDGSDGGEEGDPLFHGKELLSRRHRERRDDPSELQEGTSDIAKRWDGRRNEGKREGRTRMTGQKLIDHALIIC